MRETLTEWDTQVARKAFGVTIPNGCTARMERPMQTTILWHLNDTKLHDASNRKKLTDVDVD